MSDLPKQVLATDLAIHLIRVLREKHGPLMFHQSGGCCDGSSPLCMRRGELRLRNDDLLLGSIAGVSYYIDAEMYERWNRPEIVVGVSPEAGDSFSLEGTVGMHFVLLPPD